MRNSVRGAGHFWLPREKIRCLETGLIYRYFARFAAAAARRIKTHFLTDPTLQTTVPRLAIPNLWMGIIGSPVPETLALPSPAYTSLE